MAGTLEDLRYVPPPAHSRLASEFVGTYMLTLTIGCTAVMGSPVWSATAVAFVLMVLVYSLGDVSGALFNPAVTVAFALSGQIESWLEAMKYCVVQGVAASLAGLTYWWLAGFVFNLQPGQGYGWIEAMVCEVLFTALLALVVLCTTCARTAAHNQYYGLAIGCVLAAGGHAAAPISGAALNPAVAFGVDLASMGIGFGWCFAYCAYETAGGALAAGLFRLLHPEMWQKTSPSPMTKKIIAEFLGSFFITLTLGLNVLTGSQAAAWSTASCLVALVYAFAPISGSHFNPAVTFAICLSGRGKCQWADACVYIPAQVAGGIAGAFTYAGTAGGVFALQPGPGYGWLQVFVAEAIFTFLLCSVVLHVATLDEHLSDFFGFAIGMCVTVGGYAVGGISGGVLNPAVAIGIDTAHAAWNGGWSAGLVYALFELIGGAVATAIFFGLRPSEFNKARGVKRETAAIPTVRVGMPLSAVGHSSPSPGRVSR